ncbi:MAG: ATP-binding protein [Bryobacteraceae bacterium]
MPDGSLRRVAVRLALSLAGVAAYTFATHDLARVNAATAGFGYLLLILVIASTWGFLEALVASLAATLGFNFFFFPPIGAFTIADPHNWVALGSFLATSVIASRLSAIAKRRALDAVRKQRDLERLYAFSRGILMTGGAEPFPQQLARTLADVFELSAAVLYERQTDAFYRAGPKPFGGMDEQLRESAREGRSFSDPPGARQIAAVRIGGEPVASLALQGGRMPATLVEGIANLVAIGLERARAQDLAHQVEAARQSDQLRTTLIDALAHELKTPLTSIKAATTSLLAVPGQAEESRIELLRIADEEADHLRNLIDDAIDMARLDTARIDVAWQISDPCEAVREVVESMKTDGGSRRVTVVVDGPAPPARFDRRLLKLAVKQLLDNALKYSPPESAVQVRIGHGDGFIRLDVTNRGKAIPAEEMKRIFDRFYRSPSVKHRIPGSGLGLSIAQRIAQAHMGDLTAASGPDGTRFRLTLPLANEGARN